MATLTKDRPKAYSYIRWSSPVQAKGNTLERQLERAKIYAEENGLDLVDDQRWRDPNTSGFKGKNWHEGALGAFVSAVRDGTIPQGSYLLVEALDRISRDDTFDAVARLKEIVETGITIVTLMDSRQWDAKSLKDTGNQFYLVGMFSTANIESKNKQDRSLQNWKRKRRLAVEQGRAPTRTCPLWLTVGDDGRYQAIPERAEVVRLIYKIALEGLGSRRIARRLNEMGVPKFTDPSRARAADSRGWSGSYVYSVLTTDATIGVWRGYQIAPPSEGGGDFTRRMRQDEENGIVDDGSVYPAVVDKDIWFRVQELMKVRGGDNGGGRPKKPVGRAVTSMSNLFSGMCRCSCGAGVRYHRTGKTKRPKLVCSSHLQGGSSGCEARRWDYLSVETFLLYALAESDLLDFTKLFPDKYQDTLKAAMDALEADKGKIRADLQLASEGEARLVGAIESGTDTPKMRERAVVLSKQVIDLGERLTEIEREIERQRAAPKNIEDTLTDTRQAFHEFVSATWSNPYAPGQSFGFQVEEGGYSIEQKPELSSEEMRDLREKLHMLLRGVIEEVTFEAHQDGVGLISLTLPPSDQIVMRLEDKKERVALFDEPPNVVPPMELEDVPLAAGKGLGRQRLTKALLRVHLDGDLNGDPDAVQSYAV